MALVSLTPVPRRDARTISGQGFIDILDDAQSVLYFLAETIGTDRILE